MPRLFTSHRSAAPQTVMLPQTAGFIRPRVPTEAVDIAMPSPSPPMQPISLPKALSCSELLKQQPDSPQSELTALVLVPPVPKYILKLMDSHDIDNPYLMASFNVLIENNNNPMRVPDILQAVSKKGWTQVLHKHKDRPEQLFGNALRSHQRRRENLGLPSLVFMIDAGACWKHHELDLSAASGRKKGKIWCFSLDAGFPCPYTRLGLDLETVRQCQNAPGEEGPTTTTTAKKAARPRDDSDAEDEDGTHTAPSRPAPAKKRKVAPAPAPHISLTTMTTEHSIPDQFESHSNLPAVRGDVTSAHAVASSLQPPPYVPAAPITITPHNPNTPNTKIRINQNGTRPTRSTAGRPISNLARTRGQTKRQLDLDGLEGLEAMSPEPETGYEAEGEEISAEENPVDDEELEFTNKYGATIPFLNAVADFESDRARSLSLALETAYISQSDDDDDDFHVTMQEFSDDEDMAPIKQEEDDVITPSFLLSVPSPFDDFDSSDGASIIRTPTPNLQPPVTTGLVVDQSTWENFESEGPFHGYGLGIQEIPNWDAEQISVLKDEMVNQGWSRAPSPEFHEQANRLMKPSALRLDMMNLDSAPHSPADCLGIDGGYPGSTRSSISAASSCGSLSYSTLPHTPMSEVMDPLSRRGSVFSSPASFNSPHPLILYSPCLSPTVDPERPLKCGLTHRYVYPSGDPTDASGTVNPKKVQELEESLVNFDETAEETTMSTSLLPSTSFKQLPWPPSPLSLQPIASPSPIPDYIW